MVKTFCQHFMKIKLVVRHVTLIDHGLAVKLRFAMLILAFFAESPAFSETIFTHLSPATKDDTRQGYHIELLSLALEKTVDKYGPYRLVPAPVMNAARSMSSVRDNLYPNFFVNEQVTAKRLEELGYVPFPIHMGIIGYRVFFVSPKAKQKINKAISLEQLKKFSIGQGLGWGDIEILKSNEFTVIVANNYEGLFEMVASNRIDLLARGVNEVMGEFDTFKRQIDLQLDESVAIYYPLPRYFFTHPSNETAIQRVTEGLFAAYEDGSLLRLWEKYYLDSVSRVNLSERVIFKLDNPFIEGIDKSYEKYLYKP
ncbi:MAG: hypothetical protein B6D70_12710 [gamma proteobacterium symbiont of Stewartia floridana]|nr:MAG: hypothetical protein B6D70_12710 [gamma proteobacterium symbiont of Stewartia floridana]